MHDFFNALENKYFFVNKNGSIILLLFSCIDNASQIKSVIFLNRRKNIFLSVFQKQQERNFIDKNNKNCPLRGKILIARKFERAYSLNLNQSKSTDYQ